MAEKFNLDDLGKCPSCGKLSPQSEQVKCFLCNKLFHVICSSASDDDAEKIATKDMVSSFLLPSTKKNFLFVCDKCLAVLNTVSTAKSEFQGLRNILETKMNTIGSQLGEITTMLKLNLPPRVDTCTNIVESAHSMPILNTTTTAPTARVPVVTNMSGSTSPRVFGLGVVNSTYKKESENHNEKAKCTEFKQSCINLEQPLSMSGKSVCAMKNQQRKLVEAWKIYPKRGSRPVVSSSSYDAAEVVDANTEVTKPSLKQYSSVTPTSLKQHSSVTPTSSPLQHQTIIKKQRLTPVVRVVPSDQKQIIDRVLSPFHQSPVENLKCKYTLRTCKEEDGDEVSSNDDEYLISVKLQKHVDDDKELGNETIIKKHRLTPVDCVVPSDQNQIDRRVDPLLDESSLENVKGKYTLRTCYKKDYDEESSDDDECLKFLKAQMHMV